MQIRCGKCGRDIVVPDDLAVGQHVRCPYCNEKSAFDGPSCAESPTAVRPILQHVRPSGRGMQSEHELAAKRAAVESIERRIDHDEKVRKGAARRRTAANAGSILLGLAVVAGIAFYFTQVRNGQSGVNMEKVVESVRQCLPAAIDPDRRAHAAVAAEFGKGELAPWKDAPKELKPKNAPAGTVYHALVPKGGKFDLYELKAGGAVAELSPLGKPVPMKMEDFKKACGGKPYFIACAGRVFVCGGGDLKMMDELRKALLPR